MPTLDDIAAEYADEFLTRFGRTVVHFQRGDRGLATEVTAIVKFHKPERDTERGVGTVYRAELSFAVGAVELDQADRWEFDNRQWGTELLHDPEGGLVKATVTRRASQATTSNDRSGRRR